MSRLIGEPIKVHQVTNSAITAFIWRKRLYRVLEIMSWWREPSEWWNDEPVPLFIRVNAKNSSIGTFELCKRGENWFLYRLLD